MLFSSIVFLFYFLPAVLALYYLFRFNVPIKNAILLVASLFFYAWGEPWFLFVMLASILGNYFLALFVDKYREKPQKAKFFVVLSVVLNIGLLFVYLFWTLSYPVFFTVIPYRPKISLNNASYSSMEIFSSR